MPEARDRLVRTVDVAAEYARWRLGLGSRLFDQPRPPVEPVGEGTGGITVWRDRTVRTRRVAGGGSRGRSNLRWMRMPAGMGRGSSRGFAVNSPLPSWYPRTPLQDITTVARVKLVVVDPFLVVMSVVGLMGSYDVQAYGRRRELLKLTEGGRDVDPKALGSLSPASSSSALSIRRDASPFMTPGPLCTANICKQSVGKNLLLDIVNKRPGGNLELLTPQRKLLNEIDAVSKVVLEEIKQFNETPLVKKAEREKKVRVLMTMR